MSTFEFSRPEVEYIKSKIYLTKEEEAVFDMRLENESIVKMADVLHLSTSTVNRRIKSVKRKIRRIL